MCNMSRMPAWAKLVPELLITDLAASIVFWCDLLGFRIVYDRPETGFAYLDLDGAQIMLEGLHRTSCQWVTAPLTAPLGRGLNLQIDVPNIDPIRGRLDDARWPIFSSSQERWYRAGSVELGVRQFLVQDPDGYLIRLAQDLGQREPVDAQPSK